MRCQKIVPGRLHPTVVAGLEQVDADLIFGVYYSTMQWTGAIFVLPGAALLDRFGFDTMFTWAAVGVTVVAVITAFFIWDAKDNYHAELEHSTEDESDLHKKVIKK